MLDRPESKRSWPAGAGVRRNTTRARRAAVPGEREAHAHPVDGLEQREPPAPLRCRRRYQHPRAGARTADAEGSSRLIRTRPPHRRDARSLRSSECSPRWSRVRVATADARAPHPGARRSAGIDLHGHGSPVAPIAVHRQPRDVSLRYSCASEPSAAAGIARPNRPRRRAAGQIEALLMVARVLRPPGKSERLMQAELGGEVGHRPGPEHAGVPRSPCPARGQILAQPAVGVVDPRVQQTVGGAALERRQRHLRKQ